MGGCGWSVKHIGEELAQAHLGLSAMERLNFFGSGSLSNRSLARFREFVLLVIFNGNHQRMLVMGEGWWWKLVSKGRGRVLFGGRLALN